MLQFAKMAGYQRMVKQGLTQATEKVGGLGRASSRAQTDVSRLGQAREAGNMAGVAHFQHKIRRRGARRMAGVEAGRQVLGLGPFTVGGSSGAQGSPPPRASGSVGVPPPHSSGGM